MTLVTVSGLPGTGTTTLARQLSVRLGLPIVATGEVFREMAAARGLGLEEFGALVDADPQMDRDLDRAMKAQVDTLGECIAEGRLTGMLLRDADLRVWLYALDDIRAERVLRRSGETKEEMHRREAHELARFRDIYGWTPDMLSLYDLCLNTGSLSIHDCEALAVRALAARRGF